VLGASFDTVEDNRRFAAEQHFPFRLLSDHDRTVGRDYDVVRPAGDQYEAYARRYSFLINPEGVIARIYDVADVRGHADEVLADLAQLAQVQ
jgi:peroxiredoxin Q/BCP